MIFFILSQSKKTGEDIQTITAFLQGIPWYVSQRNEQSLFKTS